MIEARIYRNDALLLQRSYAEAGLTLAEAMKRLEMYVVDEMLNVEGECTIRVRFAGLSQAA